jgi:hypothetical protein
VDQPKILLTTLTRNLADALQSQFALRADLIDMATAADIKA